MKLIDTHTHLYLSQFDEDRTQVVGAAIKQQVELMFLPNVDSSTTDSMLALEAAHPSHCYAMMGVHPCSIKENWEEELAHAKAWLEKRPFVAIGEIGMDLYWDKTFVEEQKLAFKTQIQWAIAYDIPIVIHSREATAIIIDILKEEQHPKLRGIFHCFSGTEEQAREIISLGFLLGIGGVVTFKNGGLDKVVANLSLDHLVLETDSPYLTPTPYRGKRNESAYIFNIAQKVAEIKGVPITTVAEKTTANALGVFDIEKVNSLVK